MSTLTSAIPVPAVLNNPVVPAQGTTAVLGILSARSVDSLSSPLVETLQNAAGPGNIITGTVEEAAPDGTVTVAARNGTLITVHHPPELPLELGNTVVLRIIPTASAPQAALLAVNGKPVVLRNAPSSPSAAGSASGSAASTPSPARPAPAAPAPSSASIAASFIATISLEDEVAIETALDQSDLALAGATGKSSAVDNVGPTVIATLIRPAPAKLGQVPVPSGTRYLVTLREVGGVESVGAPASARPPASASSATPVPQQAGSATPAAAAVAANAAGPVGASPISTSPVSSTTAPAATPELPVSVAATVLLALQDAIQNPAPIPGRVIAPNQDAPAAPPAPALGQAGAPPPPLAPSTIAAQNLPPPVPVEVEAAVPDAPPAPQTPQLPSPQAAAARPPAAPQSSPPQSAPPPALAAPQTAPAPVPPTDDIVLVAPLPQGETTDAQPPASPAPPSTVGQPAPPQAQAPSVAPSAAPIPDAAAFKPQISTLAGRVVAPRAPAETLVETAIGTLALPLPAPLPLGAAVQLRISAVAPPQQAAHAAPHEAAPPAAEPSAPALPPSLIEEMARALAPTGPGAAMAVQQVLAVQPGDGLAAALFTFLTGIRSDARPRLTELPGRKALLDTGRKDLVDRLDQARADIGTVRPPHGPDGWTVTILPFLGPASIRPMRLYRKQHQDKDAEGKPKGKPSERFMLEVELKRMGPLQFDGLVRERRFDLVLRSRDAFAPALQHLIEQSFQDGLLITGWTGEIGFGRVGKFPLVADPDSASHLDLGA